MPARLSIRQSLALYALLTGGGMLCLLLVFVSTQWYQARLETRVFESEVVPRPALRAVERGLGMVSLQILQVVAGGRSAVASAALLAEERDNIRKGWTRFRHMHGDGSGAPDEKALIARIDEGLPALWRFLDRAQAYSLEDDRTALAGLHASDWPALEQGLRAPVAVLVELQAHHLDAARRDLERARDRSQVLTVVLVGIGLLILSAFAIGLSRYIMRRIVEIERALEAVAAGESNGIAPYPPEEAEMCRISQAINRTVAQLADNHRAITALMRTQQTILGSAAEGIYGVDADGRLMFINPAALAMLGYREDEVLGLPSHDLFHHHHPDGTVYPVSECPIAESRRTNRVVTRIDELLFRKNGSSFPVEYTSAPLHDVDGSPSGGVVVVFHDVTQRREQEQLLQRTVAQLRETNAQLQETQSQLLQAEKLAGVGQLAAGVAHEINNPIGFMQSNLRTLDRYVQTLFELVAGYESLLDAGQDRARRAEAARLRERAEVDFLREDVGTLLAETHEGLQRVTRIVADLRDFSRLDGPGDWEDADLVQGLESTLHLVRGVIGDKARIVCDYAPLPPVRCHAGQINQVFLNLLLNAAHAIEDSGTITVRTRWQGDEVCVEVEDTGRGMEARERERMFDPFFTTKPVGEGKGLGLSVSYGIVQRHGGRFEVDSRPGRGTRIALWLPASAAALAER